MRLGSHQSDEMKARVSIALMGHAPTGPKHHTDESRAKMSAAHVNTSPETRAKLSAIHMGHDVSPETRGKISVAEKGQASCHWKGGQRVWHAKTNAKRRSLGYVELNVPFFGCEGHHINDHDVIYIPKALHQSIRHNIFTGKNIAEINAKACQWLTEDWT